MDRLHQAHLARRGTKLLQTGHEPDKSDNERRHQVFGETLMLAVAEGGYRFLPALRVELFSVGDLFRIAAAFALEKWLMVSVRISTMSLERSVDLQGA